MSEAVAEEILEGEEPETPAADADAALPVTRQLKIRGPRKAAIVAQQLGAEAASKILGELNPRQLDQLLIEIAELETSPATPEERNLAMQEFFHVHLAQNYVSQGGLDFARSALELAVGVEQAEQILGRLRGVFEVQPFDFLRKIAPQQITSFLISEQPQVIAVVLAYMPAELGARVLESLPPHLKADVSERLATMEPTDPAYVRSIERAMEAQLRDVLHQRLERKGGVEALVSILGNVDRGTERQVLDDFDVRNPALAEEVRKRMFLFEDIVKIQPRDMQKVVQGIDLNDLALALRGAEGELMMAFKNNMSERQRLNLEDIMSGLGPQPLSKIEDAQTRIVDRIRQMAENQEIVLARGNEELY